MRSGKWFFALLVLACFSTSAAADFRLHRPASGSARPGSLRLVAADAALDDVGDVAVFERRQEKKVSLYAGVGSGLTNDFFGGGRDTASVARAVSGIEWDRPRVRPYVQASAIRFMQRPARTDFAIAFGFRF